MNFYAPPQNKICRAKTSPFDIVKHLSPSPLITNTIVIVVNKRGSPRCELQNGDVRIKHHHQCLDFFNPQGIDLRAEETDNLLLAIALRSSGIVLSVQSLMFSDRILNCRSRLRPPLTVSCMMVLQSLLRPVT